MCIKMPNFVSIASTFAEIWPFFLLFKMAAVRHLGFLGRLPNFGSRPNTIWVATFRPSVRPSTKSFFNFDEIWYTGSTR